MKVIAIRTDNPDQGQFVYTSLMEAVAKGRTTLEDVAVLGDTGIVHTKGRVGRTFGAHVDDDALRRIAERDPATWVLALGPDAEVDGIARRVQTLTKGEMRTFEVEGSDLHETTDSEATYDVDDTEGALLAEPEVAFDEEMLPRGRLSRP